MQTDTTPTEEPELVLHAGDLRLRVSPFGASLRGLWREAADGSRADIISVYSGKQNKVGGQGDVLIPFPGRVRDGRYDFDGHSYEMAKNDKDGPNAIHGFVRLRSWEIAEQSDSSVTFTIAVLPDAQPGYPFALAVRVTYTLAENGLTCRFAVTNTGEQTAPVGTGFHPYFTVGSDTIDTDLLRVPMDSMLEFDSGLLPTGNVLPVTGTPYDFCTPWPIGDVAFNTCYCGPVRDADGLCRIRLAAADQDRAVTVWMDAAFDYVVLYSGDPLPPTHRRRSLAIEPMTCGSDAFNYPDWGLVALPPGETFTGTWGVTPE